MNTKGLVARVEDFFTSPFTALGTQLTPLQWILLVGFLLVVLWFWQHILLMIADEV